MQIASKQTAEEYGIDSASKIIGESLVNHKKQDPAINRVEHSEGKMKRIIGTLTLATGLVLLLAGVPTMAADTRPEPPGNHGTLTESTASGIVDLESLHSTQARQEKPKPKRRDPGRQNPFALESPCSSAGFLGNLFGALVGLDWGCGDGEARDTSIW